MSWVPVFREWCRSLCPFVPSSKNRVDEQVERMGEGKKVAKGEEDEDIQPESVLEELEGIVEEQRELDAKLDPIVEEPEIGSNGDICEEVEEVLEDVADGNIIELKEETVVEKEEVVESEDKESEEKVGDEESGDQVRCFM